MLTIPQYLLESSFCLLIFYGFYTLFLRKETFFQLNRAYLVLTPALSLSIPLLNISFQKDAPAESFEAFLYPAIQSAHNINDLVWEQMRAPSPVFSLSVADVLMAIYLIGVFLMAFTLLRGLWNLTRIIRSGKRSKNKEFTLIETHNNFPAASFFGYIFWNQQITDEQKLILEHEKVHIRQWHSLDVLLMEICVIIKWFNPLIYWFRNALRATHEYIADQYVIQQKSNVQDYATLLVNQQKSLTPSPLTNTFYSLTTKRLKMMLQRPSNKAYAVKYLMIIPIMASLLLLFSFNLVQEFPQFENSLTTINEVIDDFAETNLVEIEQETIDNLGVSLKKRNSLITTPMSNIQIKWGKYTFNCKESIVDNRKTCNCEGKYIRKADLKKINKKGFEFMVNGESQAFDQVYVNTFGFVYCKKEDLMLSSDLQRTYNPKACIWNAFDEGEKGWVRFTTKNYESVHFNFAINSSKGTKNIEPNFFQIGQEKINIRGTFSAPQERPSLTFGQIKEMLNQSLLLNVEGEKLSINAIKIAVVKDKLHHKFQDIKQPDVLKEIENFYPSDKLFYLSWMPNLNRSANQGKDVDLFFQLSPEDELYKKDAYEFSWGAHHFSFKNPIIKVSKKELKRLINEEQIYNYLGNPIKQISGIRFIFQEEENTLSRRLSNSSIKEMLKEPSFKHKFDQLKAGDFLNIINLHSDFVSGGLTIFIAPDKQNNDPYFRLTSGKGKVQNQFNHPKAIFYRNHNLSSILADLLEVKPHQLKFKNPNNQSYLNLTYIPAKGIDIKSDLLAKINAIYPFTIKQKIVEKEGWFLSGGNTKKLEQFRQKNLPTNLTLFTEDNTKKGIETLGPVKFDWFATNYFKSKYQIDVINLTDFEGKYVFPLDSQNLQTLQQQLKRDFDLDLKKQRRSIEIKEIVFD